jgi:hypothetical protein
MILAFADPIFNPLFLFHRRPHCALKSLLHNTLPDRAVFAQLSRRNGNKAYWSHELKIVGGRLMLVRNELDRMYDLALRDDCGCEIEPDDKDGMFLD